MVFPSSVSPRFEEIDVSVENSKILQDPRCKYLGFIIDEKLKWTKHIELVCIKLVKFLGIIYKLRSVLPAWCLRAIWYSYLHPHLLFVVKSIHLHLDKIIK